MCIRDRYNPIPHFPARSITDLNMLKSYVEQVKEAGVKQVLIIGGDRDILGDYHCSLQLIETGLFDGLKIGIAGHPEGSPNMSNDAIDEAMKSKAPFADYIVCLLYTSPSPRDKRQSRMPSSA